MKKLLVVILSMILMASCSVSRNTVIGAGNKKCAGYANPTYKFKS